MEETVEKMKKSYEGPSEWKLRKLFLLKNFDSGFASDRLECLSNCFVYEVLYGVSYPQPVMDEVKRLSGGIVQEVFPNGLPSYRGASTSNKESAPSEVSAQPKKKKPANPGAPSEVSAQPKKKKPANPEQQQLAMKKRPLLEVARTVVAQYPSLENSDRQWMSVKNYETMLRIAGPQFRPIHFVKASAGGAEAADDDDQPLCFPNLKMGESMLNYNPQKTEKSSKPPEGQQQTMESRAASPPASGTVTKIVITLQRLFETWLLLSEKNPKINCVGSLISAAGKAHIPLKINAARQNSQIGLVGFTCTIVMADPETGATVILAEGCSRAKKEARYLACSALIKFRDRHIEVDDLQPDSSGKDWYRLIHNRKITKSLQTPHKNVPEVPSSSPVAPISSVDPQDISQVPQGVPQDAQQGAQQGAPRDTPPSAPQGAQQSAPPSAPPMAPPAAPAPLRRVPRRSESAIPKSVFLKEVVSGQGGAMQVLVTTAAMHSLQMEVESLSDDSHCLRFLGQVWGPLTGLSLVKAKRLLAEAAVNDLRWELWTLRIRQMPDFSALQDVAGVRKESALQASEEQRCGDAPLDVGNVGHRMLRQMGWNAGRGLGKDGEGRKVPVSTDMTLIKRQGLGLKVGGSSANSFRQFMWRRLREFCDAGVNAEDLCFSSDFNNEERAAIHQNCRKYPGLESRSFNTADGNRFLVVMRKRTPRELLDWVIAKGGSTIRYEAFPPGRHPEIQKR